MDTPTTRRYSVKSGGRASGKSVTEMLRRHLENTSTLLSFLQRRPAAKLSTEEREFLRSTIPVADAIKVAREAGYTVSRH